MGFDPLMVYILLDQDCRLVKIGTTVNVERRISQLELKYGKCFKLLKVIPGGRKEEAALHRRFRDWRIRGTEFFLISRELESWIELPLSR